MFVLIFQIFIKLPFHVETQLGNDIDTLENVMKIIKMAEARFGHLGIQSFEIYQLEASLPFKVPADTSNPPVSSAISSTL